MSLHTRLIDPFPPQCPEDIFSSGIAALFQDPTLNQHGTPGSRIIYRSPRYGDIDLRLADPDPGPDRWLFAHYLWNAGLILAALVEEEEEGPERDRGGWAVAREKVVELGAGSGLCGILCAKAGAAEVTITDYPTPALLRTLEQNIKKNIPPSSSTNVTVHPHRWGEALPSHAHRYTRVLVADCLWLAGEHVNLLWSMKHFLSLPNEDDGDGKNGPRVWVVAGFHTGRNRVTAFFDLVAEDGELFVDKIWERDVDGVERDWARERTNEDDGVSKRWVVVAILRRR